MVGFFFLRECYFFPLDSSNCLSPHNTGLGGVWRDLGFSETGVAEINSVKQVCLLFILISMFAIDSDLV